MTVPSYDGGVKIWQQSMDVSLDARVRQQLQNSASDPQRDRALLACLTALSYRTGDLREYLQAISENVSEILGIDWSVVTFCQDDTETVLASSRDLGATDPTYKLHGTLTGTVFKSGQPLVVQDVKRSPQHGSAPEGYCAYLGLPLRAPNGKSLGTVCCFNHEPREFAEADLAIAQLFAERAAIALDNYLLYQQQQAFNVALAEEVARQTEALRTAQAQLIERERLAAIGTFAASIVHELRNPATTIKLALDFFQRRVPLDEDARVRLGLARDESRRLETLLEEILLYAKPHVLQQEVVALDRFMLQVLEEFQGTPIAAGRTLNPIVPARSLPVEIDRDKFKQVSINLLCNACEAVEPGATVTCRLSASEDRVVLQIVNGGEPIPPEVLPRLTEPFFTTKASGTGLGLAIVKRIIAAHDGTFELSSSAATGTIATASLPRASMDLPAD